MLSIVQMISSELFIFAIQFICKNIDSFTEANNHNGNFFSTVYLQFVFTFSLSKTQTFYSLTYHDDAGGETHSRITDVN